MMLLFAKEIVHYLIRFWLPITYGIRVKLPNIYADTAGTYSVTVGNGTTVMYNNSLSFDGVDDYVRNNIPFK